MKKLKGIFILISIAPILTSCSLSGDKNAVLRYFDAGVDMVSEGNYEDAVNSFDKALENAGLRVTPEAIDINYYKAAALYLSGDFKGAADVCTALIEYDDKNKDAYFLRGLLYADEKDIESAVSDFKSAIKCDEDDYDLYISIYEHLYALSYQDEAITFLNLALEAKVKDDADSDIGRGRIYMYLNQLEASEKALLKAKEKGDERADLYLAEVYERQGDKEKAAEYMDAFASSEKKTADTLLAMGNLLMDDGEYDKALDIFREGLKLDDTGSAKDLKKGEISALEHTGQFSEAYKMAREFLEEYPLEADVLREIPFLLTRFEGPYEFEEASAE